MISQTRELLLFDRTLFYALATRMWQALSGPVTIVVIIGVLTVEEQGRYYSLAALMSIQVFFELGMLNVLISQSSYLNLQLSQATGRRSMRRLMQLSINWFRIVAMLFALTSTSVGWWILSKQDGTTDWKLPLIFLVLVSAATVAISPCLAILEGAGFRQHIYAVRFLQLFTGALAVWIALILDLKLWALVVSATVQLLWTTVVVAYIFRPWAKSLQITNLPISGTLENLDQAHLRQPGSTRLLTWFADIFPKQWPSAVVSIATHTATQFFSLVILVYQGQAEAGRIGMTLTVTTAIQALSLSWLQTKFAVISRLCSQQQFQQAKLIWRRSVQFSLVMLIVLLALFTLLLMLLPLASQGWEFRLIQPKQLGLLSIGIVACQLLVSQNYFALASNRQPLWRASLLGHCVTLFSVILAGRNWGIDGIVVAFALTSFLITLPLHTRDFLLQSDSTYCDPCISAKNRG